MADRQPTSFSCSRAETLGQIQAQLQNSADLVIRTLNIDGLTVSTVNCEMMISDDFVSRSLFYPLAAVNLSSLTVEEKAQELLSYLETKLAVASDQKRVETYADFFPLLMSGFVVVLIDTLPFGLAIGMQGYPYRSISEPNFEVDERASREGFVEPYKVNMSLIRRRLKTPKLVFEQLKVGKSYPTDVAIAYLTDKAKPKLVEKVKKALENADITQVLESGYLQPFLEDKPHLFSTVGLTERPDTVCAKLNEGRVAIITDGTPFVLLVPYLFIEHFQNFDDYSKSAYFGSFLRLLKYLAFFLSIFLPGLYVACATYHSEVLPRILAEKIIEAQGSVPFSVWVEAFVIHLVFEIMREAGIRLPRTVGHAVSIVGGLVIGDAAVTAGLISEPMLMILAITMVSSFVVPTLYQAGMVLRFSFILAGGWFSFYGIALLASCVLLTLCGQQSMGVPYLAPVTPFAKKGMRDTFIRRNWRTLGKEAVDILDLPGSDVKGEE